MKKIIKASVVITLLLFLGSCSVFKKGCDCPKFGKSQLDHRPAGNEAPLLENARAEK